MNNSGQNFAKIKPASYPQIVSFLVYFPIDFHYSFFYKKKIHYSWVTKLKLLNILQVLLANRAISYSVFVISLQDQPPKI